MELRENMYIRYVPTLGEYTQKISKITNIKNCMLDMCYTLDNKEKVFSSHFDEIIKASDKLIDLVEVKDIVKVRIDNMFVNYFVVDPFEDEEENEVLGIACYEDGMLNTISEYRPLDTLEILEVLTHEQIDQMSYKVGE